MITRPIQLFQYGVSAAWEGYVMHVSQGGVVKSKVTEKQEVISNGETYRRYPVCDGRSVYWPVQKEAVTNYGGVSFNAASQEWDFQAGFYAAFPSLHYVQDRMAHLSGSMWVYGTPRRLIGGGTTTYWGVPQDGAILGNKVFSTDNTDTFVVWSYPFSSAPSVHVSGDKVSVLCPFQNDMYGLELATTSYLRKWNGGSGFPRVGSGVTPVESSDLQTNQSGKATLFEWGGKLYCYFSYNTGATWLHRCYEVNPSTGVFTQRDDLVPASFRFAPATNYRGIFEVHDDLGSSRQTYLISNEHRTTAGWWQLEEFADPLPSSPGQASGSEEIYNGGIVFDDQNAGGCAVQSMSDHGDYVEINHGVADIKDNSNTDVKIRYKDLGDSSYSPPPDDATEYQSGSEGRTGLSTKPSQSSLSDLDDDFSDGVLDTDLWEEVTPWIHNYGDLGWFPAYDYNTSFHNLNMGETGGRLWFGNGITDRLYAQGAGIGVKGRWSVSGDFQADVTLAGLSALDADNSRYYRFWLMFKLSCNKAIGVYIWKNTTPTIYARPFYLQPDAGINSLVEGTDSTNQPADGKVIRISRSSGTWSLILDPSGSNEDLSALISLPTNYTGPVFPQFFCAKHSGATTLDMWTSVSEGPGISNYALSGSGSLFRWDGAIPHVFRHDTPADLGVGATKSLQYFTGQG